MNFKIHKSWLSVLLILVLSISIFGAVPSLSAQSPNPTCTDPATEGDALDLSITNHRDETITLVWFSYDCQEDIYETIAPGETITQGSYVNHNWIIRASDGSAIYQFAASPDNANIVISPAAQNNNKLNCPTYTTPNFAGIDPVFLQAGDVVTVTSQGGIAAASFSFDKTGNTQDTAQFNCDPGTQDFTAEQAGLYWLEYNGSGNTDALSYEVNAEVVEAVDTLVCPTYSAPNFAGIDPVFLQAGDVVTVTSQGGIASVSFDFTDMTNTVDTADFNCDPSTYEFTAEADGIYLIGYNGSGNADSFSYELTRVSAASQAGFPFAANMVSENPPNLLTAPDGDYVWYMDPAEAITVTGISDDGSWYSIIDSIGNEGWVPASSVVLSDALSVPMAEPVVIDFGSGPNYVDCTGAISKSSLVASVDTSGASFQTLHDGCELHSDGNLTVNLNQSVNPATATATVNSGRADVVIEYYDSATGTLVGTYSGLDNTYVAAAGGSANSGCAPYQHPGRWTARDYPHSIPATRILAMA